MRNYGHIQNFLREKLGKVSTDQLLNNIFWNVIARFGSAGINFLMTIFLMSIMDVAEYGEFVVFLSVYSTIPFFLDFGLNNSFVPLGSRARAADVGGYDKLINDYMSVKIIVVALMVIITVVAMGVSWIDKNIFIILVLGSVLGLWEFLLTIFKSLQNFKLLSKLLPVRNVVAFAGVLIVYYIFKNDNWNTYLVVIMTTPAVLTLIVYIAYFRRVRISFTWESLKTPVLQSKWIALFGIVTAVHARADIYLLEYFAKINVIDSKEVGIFSAAFSLLAVINLVTATFAEAVLPKVSQEANISYYREFLTRIKKTIPYVLLLSAMVGTTLYFVFTFGFQGKYQDSVHCILFIGCGMICLFYLHTLYTLFYPMGRTDLVFKTVLVMFVFNVILGAILIPGLGSLGAAVTNLLVSFIGLIFTLHALKKTLPVYE